MQAQDKLDTKEGSETIRQPAVFIGHGSPMVAIEFDEWNDQICSFLEQIPTPKTILIVSAHWVTSDGIHITSSEFPEQLYDFDKSLYPDTLTKLTYPCMGDPSLAKEVANILEQKGYTTILDENHGLDHGAWVPLYVAFPNMDVPVVELSLPADSSPRDVYQLGKILAPLRKRGVLLIGSGNIVNNKDLSNLENKYAGTDPWATDFDLWFKRHLKNFEVDTLFEYENQAPHVEKAVTNKSHILPLFFVLGSLFQSDYHYNLFEGFHYGNISMRSFALVNND